MRDLSPVTHTHACMHASTQKQKRKTAWGKVFRIISELWILRLTFTMENQPQNAELGQLY